MTVVGKTWEFRLFESPLDLFNTNISSRNCTSLKSDRPLAVAGAYFFNEAVMNKYLHGSSQSALLYLLAETTNPAQWPECAGFGVFTATENERRLSIRGVVNWQNNGRENTNIYRWCRQRESR